MSKLVEEGQSCLDPDCSGHFEFKPSGDCYCHLSPPCHYCVESRLVCDSCRSDSEDFE